MMMELLYEVLSPSMAGLQMKELGTRVTLDEEGEPRTLSGYGTA
jgi:hypothetical protein